MNARRPKSVDIYGTWRSCWVEVGELVMGGIPEGDYKDRMADRLLRSYRLSVAILNCIR